MQRGAGFDREPYARRPPPRSAFGRVGPPPQGGRGIARRLCVNPLARMGEVESRGARPGEGLPFAAEPAEPSVLRPGPSPLPLSRSGEGLASARLAEKPADEIAQADAALALEALGPEDRGQVVEGAGEVVVDEDIVVFLPALELGAGAL